MASRSKAMVGKSATSIRLDQGHRNSIISGEALKKRIPDIFLFLPILLFDFRQPLISGEARASPVSPVPTPLHMLTRKLNFQSPKGDLNSSREENVSKSI